MIYNEKDRYEKGSEVTELPIIKYPAPDRGERRLYYMPPPEPKDTPAGGTEVEENDGYHTKIYKDKSDQ